MKKMILLLIAPFCMYSQSNEMINPKGKWYFGAELGLNKVTSFGFDEGKYSVSCGGIAEYYFAKQWSIQAKVKYMKTGVSYLKKTVYGWDWDWWKNAPLADSDYGIYNRFDAHTIAIPLDIKWEFRLYENLHASLKLGTALNIETQSTYHYNATDSESSSVFVNLNLGYGVNYYISESYSLGVDMETFTLGGESKGRTSDGSNTNHGVYAKNTVYNLQLKYHF